MSDRRTLHRRHLIYYLKVFERETDTLLGHLVDITEEGLMIVSENPIDGGKEFKLRMLLPREIEGKEEIEFEATSTWCRTDVNPSLFGVGFKFDYVDTLSRQIIFELIHEFAFSD
ncbi:MAG: PilZ domain-containing protein [Leptolinea sp.]